MLLNKTNKNWGQKLRGLSIFFRPPRHFELKQKIRAWKYASDLVRIQTLSLSKLWVGKFLKRLTFVQRTFRLPCSSTPSLPCFPRSILCFRSPFWRVGLFLIGRSIFLRKKIYSTLSDDCVVSPWLWCLECTVFCCGSCPETIGSVKGSRGFNPAAAQELEHLVQTIYFKMTVISKTYTLVKSHHNVTQAPRWWGNSGQNFNWSSIMWKQQLLLRLYVACVLGGLTHAGGLKRDTACH